MDSANNEPPVAPALVKRPLAAEITHVAGRLWRRLLTGDFIRRRARNIRPPKGSNVPAFAIAYNAHGGYCVPLDSVQRPCARAIMAGRVWEPATIDLILGALGDGDVIHAGAFFGDFLPPLARRLAPGAWLWGFEPNSLNFKATRLTLSINEIENVNLMRAGLGAESVDARLAVATKKGLALGGSSFVSGAIPDDYHAEAIRLVALDDVIPADRKVDVIHLDVEGYEQQALAGALHLIERERPLIILETPPSPAWFEAHLASLGYEQAETVDENTVYRAEGREER